MDTDDWETVKKKARKPNQRFVAAAGSASAKGVGGGSVKKSNPPQARSVQSQSKGYSSNKGVATPHALKQPSASLSKTTSEFIHKGDRRTAGKPEQEFQSKTHTTPVLTIIPSSTRDHARKKNLLFTEGSPKREVLAATRQQTQGTEESNIAAEETAKKKKTKKVALYDLLMIPKNHGPMHTGGAKLERATKTPLASETKLKSFVARKKKKILSIVRKKILLERLRLFNASIEVDVGASTLNEVISTGTTQSTACTIAVSNFLDADMNECDALEIAEMERDLRELVAPFGDCLDVTLLPQPQSGSGTVFVRFRTALSARSAEAVLDGTVVAGEALRVCICDDPNTFAATSLSTQDSSFSKPQETLHTSLKLDTAQEKLSVAVIEKLVQSEDTTNEDETEEILNDLHSLCARHGVICGIWLEEREQKSAPCDTFSDMPGTSEPDKQSCDAHSVSGMEGREPWVLVEFGSFRDTLAAFAALQGCLIAGHALQTVIYDTSRYESRSFVSSGIVCENVSIQSINLQSETLNAVRDLDATLYAIRLNGYVTADELSDADEIKEICLDLLKIFGAAQTDTKNDSDQVALLFEPSQAPHASEEEGTHVVALFASHDMALTAWANLADHVAKGLQVDAELFQAQAAKAIDIIERALGVAHAQVGLTLGELFRLVNNDVVSMDPLSGGRLQHSSWSSSVLLVRNYISLEDLSECSGSDDLTALKKDLVGMYRERVRRPAGEAQSFATDSLRRVSIADFAAPAQTPAAREDQSQTSVVACVAFANQEDAEACMFANDDSVIGGQRIGISISRTHMPHREDVNGGESHASSCARVLAVRNDAATGNEVGGFTAAEACQGTPAPAAGASEVHAPSSATATATALSSIDTSLKVAVPKEATEGEAEASVVSKYVEAKEKPKQGTHSTPLVDLPVASEELNAVIKSFLVSLATFQARTREKDPLKAKQKMRFVTGMRQVRKRALIHSRMIATSEDLSSFQCVNVDVR